MEVPKGYRGIIVQEAGKEKTASKNTEKEILEGEQEQEQGEVTVLDEIGSFEEVVIWNHESMVDGDDAFVKGLGEWISFADAVSYAFPACAQIYVYIYIYIYPRC